MGGTQRLWSQRLAEIAAVLVLIVLGMGAAIARAQGAPAAASTILTVKGEVKQELRLSAADLQALPRTKVTAKGHDGVSREYEGVTLQALLAKAGVPIGHEIRGKNMPLAVILDASDDYHVVFSLAELDGDFAGEQVLVADTSDGKPLDAQHGPVQTIVPGDKREGRWVRMLTTIRVVKAG